MKKLTKKEIRAMVSEELKCWLFDEIHDLITITKSEIRFGLLSPDFMTKIKKCTDVAFSFDDDVVGSLPSGAAWLLFELVEFKKYLLNVEEGSFENSFIVQQLEIHISKMKSGDYRECDFIIAEEDVNFAKEELYRQKSKKEQEEKELAERKAQVVAARIDSVKKWRAENLCEEFDPDILDELELKILRQALDTELKCVSVSWLQRNFAMGYVKAASIIEHLEECGVISTFEEAEKLGLGRSGRIIKISL